MSEPTISRPEPGLKRMAVLSLILVAVCLEVVGQMLYKTGIDRTPVIHGSMWEVSNLLAFAGYALSNWLVLGGLAVYAAEVFLWWLVLSKVDVSYAFPLTSMSYVVLLAVAGAFLHEHVNWERWLGATAIMIGVFLITRSAPLPH
ncbi:MAG: EamA family transporter [Terriglobales bacterium]